MRSHHGLYDDVLELDEAKDHDREKDLEKEKLTFTECLIALVIAITCVSLHAVFLGKLDISDTTLSVILLDGQS